MPMFKLSTFNVQCGCIQCGCIQLIDLFYAAIFQQYSVVSCKSTLKKGFTQKHPHPILYSPGNYTEMGIRYFRSTCIPQQLVFLK